MLRECVRLPTPVGPGKCKRWSQCGFFKLQLKTSVPVHCTPRVSMPKLSCDAGYLEEDRDDPL
jgi:hypothetical protein